MTEDQLDAEQGEIEREFARLIVMPAAKRDADWLADWCNALRRANTLIARAHRLAAADLRG